MGVGRDRPRDNCVANRDLDQSEQIGVVVGRPYFGNRREEVACGDGGQEGQGPGQRVARLVERGERVALGLVHADRMLLVAERIELVAERVVVVVVVCIVVEQLLVERRADVAGTGMLLVVVDEQQIAAQVAPVD